MDENRFIELETKIAHQELSIDVLQKVVYEQQTTIDRLEKSLKALSSKIDGALAGENEIGPAHQKPPHY